MEIKWSDDSDDHHYYDLNEERSSIDHPSSTLKERSQSCINSGPKIEEPHAAVTCPSCGHKISQLDDQVGIVKDLPSLPAGVKFDPSDNEILMHLEAKVSTDRRKIHPLIDEFIPTLEGENGICYTHPEKLPGVRKDGQVRHFFHRPSKAYTTGTRKRRKVSTDENGNETRWHKTGKTRPVLFQGTIKGFKKILVLYTNYGRQKKPEKTNWVMHQYHLGHEEDEKHGELVLSKVFYQTQPRQTSTTGSCSVVDDNATSTKYKSKDKNAPIAITMYNRDEQVLGFDQHGGGGHGRVNRENYHQQINPDEVMVMAEGDGSSSSSFLRFTSDANKSGQSFIKHHHQ